MLKVQTSASTLEASMNPVLEGVYVILQRAQHVYGMAAPVTVLGNGNILMNG